MIALHLRDSPAHLIAPTQLTGFGIPVSFGGSSFHGRAPTHFCKTVTLNLRDLYRVRCYSLVDIVHNKYKEVQSQGVLWIRTKTWPAIKTMGLFFNKTALRTHIKTPAIISAGAFTGAMPLL